MCVFPVDIKTVKRIRMKFPFDLQIIPDPVKLDSAQLCPRVRKINFSLTHT